MSQTFNCIDKKKTAAELMDKVAAFIDSDGYLGSLGDFVTANCIYYDTDNYTVNFAREKNI